MKLIFDLIKAKANHKYLKRVKKKGKYVYTYADEKDKKKKSVIKKKSIQKKKVNKKSEKSILTESKKDEKRKLKKSLPINTKTKQGKIIAKSIKNNKVKYTVKEKNKIKKVDESKVEIIPVKDDKIIKKLIANANPENRKNTINKLTGGKKVNTEIPLYTELKIGKPFKYEDRDAPNWTNVVVNRYASESELEKGNLDIILPINMDLFRRSGCELSYVQVSQDKFLVKIPYKSGDTYSKTNFNYFLVNSDLLAFNKDFFTRKIKKQLKEQAEKYMEELRERKKNNPKMYETYTDARIKKLANKMYKLKMMQKNKMSWEQFNFIKNYYNLETNADIWKKYREYNTEQTYKENDMQALKEDNENTYSKGEETSYGDSNIKKDLKKDFGVYIKRQNGKELTKPEITQIKNFMNETFKFYGDKKKECEDFNLKISYSGDKLMHARKASGLFFPSFRAIGVSGSGGAFTAIHEFAHFFDYLKGQKSDRRFKSHDFNSIEYKIASNFREGMRDKGKSDYWNRTEECFARAFSLYYETEVLKIPEEFSNFKSSKYCNKQKYEESVKPFIKEWLKDNKSFIKSLTI